MFLSPGPISDLKWQKAEDYILMNKISIDASNKIAEFRKTGQTTGRHAAKRAVVKTRIPLVSGQNDKIDFSGRAGEAAKLSARVATLPDIRSEVVAHFKRFE